MNVESTLRDRGIQPSAQRVAVAEYVLRTAEHPSADLVWRRVRERFPWISRATVYNTLHLFVEKGLLQRLTIAEESGAIHDVPWERVQVCNLDSLHDYDIRQYQVVMHGKLKETGAK